MSSASSLPYSMTKRERENLQQVADYTQVKSLPEIWPIAAERFNTTIALHDPHSKPEVKLSYTQLEQQIRTFAAGLQALGVNAESKVSLFSDNSPRWFIADQGIMRAGAVNAVRSSQADEHELIYILGDSQSSSLVVEDLKTFKKLRSQLDDLPIKSVVLLSDETPPEDTLTIVNFPQLMEMGQQRELEPVSRSPEMLATLLYTSGTTGQPKGVMLTHANLLHQVQTLGVLIQPQKGDRVLSILPSWHALERTAEYFLLSQGCTQIYTNRRSFKKDFRTLKPHYMVSVPRIWEAIYEEIQKQLSEQPASKQKLVNRLIKISQDYITALKISEGLSLDHPNPSAREKALARLKATSLYPLHKVADRLVYSKIREATGGMLKNAISGGGALATHIDQFYVMVGISVLVGYGLTETAPVTNARRYWQNVIGSSGPAIPGTEICIVDVESRKPLPQGQKGIVWVRGPQVMQGYYNKPEATRKAINEDGWFDTGDLGWLTPNGNLVITGRAKDTIVLSNGENIEPQPIENACARSRYIDQIMLVGQDMRSLGALIVPNLDTLQQWIKEQNLKISLEDESALNNSQPIRDLFRQEMSREVKDRPGYSSNDRIGPFTLIVEPFSIENGMMTQTLKIKRPVVTERYQAIINEMFAKQ